MPAPRPFPLWVKLAFTAFVCVLVPAYWHAYGPLNFLFFCDLSLFLTLAALWLDSPLLSSMPALLIILPQIIWVVDFVAGLFGHFPVGLTAYMFDSANPLFIRSLSLFHGWLPFLLVWMVWYQGYDRRALVPQLLLTGCVLVVCYLVSPLPPAPSANAVVNIDYVFAPPWSETSGPQTAMPPLAWLGLLMAFFAVCILVPSHFLLSALFAPKVEKQYA